MVAFGSIISLYSGNNNPNYTEMYVLYILQMITEKTVDYT